METKMEVDPVEATLANIDDPQNKSSLSEESPEIELSSPVKSSPEIIPSSQTMSSEADVSNQNGTPEALPSTEITSDQTSEDMSGQVPSTQANPPDQTTSKTVSADPTVGSSEVPPPQVVSSPETSSDQVVPPSPGPSSEAVASKITNGPSTKKQCLDYHSMSTGVYLDSTVVPILHLALVTLDRLRPADPVQYVIDFLLRHKAQYSKSKEQPAPNSSANKA